MLKRSNMYVVPVSLLLNVKGNYPRVIHPEIGEEVGANGEKFIITLADQFLYETIFELQDGEISIINELDDNHITIQTKSKDSLSLKVEYVDFYVEEDGTGIMGITVNLPIEASNGIAAYTQVAQIMNEDNISIPEFTFVDKKRKDEYHAKVEFFEVEVSDYIESVA